MSLRTISGSRLAPFEPLRGRTVAILGFGNQGAAHALNLRDSGAEVMIGNRPDTGGAAGLDRGFTPIDVGEAASRADLVVIALPDEVQADVWRDHIEPRLRPGAVVGFLHGFNIHYELIRPPRSVGVVMIAPKGPGSTLRRRYEEGRGIPCLFALHQEAVAPAGTAPDRPGAEAIGLAWANGIGCARASIVYTTFAEETETDLFGEQTVLCGGMTELMVAAFETLVEAGYPPELAYMECCQEVKQVADLLYERGMAEMMEAISNTAEFGAYGAGPRLIDPAVRARMREVLAEIRDGRFAATLREDHAAGFPWFTGRRAALCAHPVEEAGRGVRAWMSQGATGREA